jgi:hypothetical protein
VLKSKRHKLNHGLNETSHSLQDVAKSKDMVADTLQKDTPMEQARRRNSADARVESMPPEQAPPRTAILQAHEKLIEESVQYTPPMEHSQSSYDYDC